MMDNCIYRWNKEYPGTAMINMRASSTKSTRCAFLYWPTTIPTEGRFGKRDIVKAVITQEAFFYFFITDETILREGKV